jgi:hypothetical protein
MFPPVFYKKSKSDSKKEHEEFKEIMLPPVAGGFM